MALPASNEGRARVAALGPPYSAMPGRARVAALGPPYLHSFVDGVLASSSQRGLHPLLAATTITFYNDCILSPGEGRRSRGEVRRGPSKPRYSSVSARKAAIPTCIRPR